MVLRPELEIANPVLFTESNEVFYIQGLVHSITVGGEATTTLTCNLGRQYNQRPPDLCNFMMTNEFFYKTTNANDTNPYSDDLLDKFLKEQDNFMLPYDTKNTALNNQDDAIKKQEEQKSQSKTGQNTAKKRKNKKAETDLTANKNTVDNAQKMKQTQELENGQFIYIPPIPYD
jgi:hypothetical protein